MEHNLCLQIDKIETEFVNGNQIPRGMSSLRFIILQTKNVSFSVSICK